MSCAICDVCQISRRAKRHINLQISQTQKRRAGEKEPARRFDLYPERFLFFFQNDISIWKSVQTVGEAVFAYLPSMKDRRFARCFFNMPESICKIFPKKSLGMNAVFWVMKPQKHKQKS